MHDLEPLRLHHALRILLHVRSRSPCRPELKSKGQLFVSVASAIAEFVACATNRYAITSRKGVSFIAGDTSSNLSFAFIFLRTKMLTSIGTRALATATRASLSPAAKRMALGSLIRMADRQVLPFSTLREEDDQEKLEELEASIESTPNAFGGAGYEWEDPFRLKTQLTEEEVRLQSTFACVSLHNNVCTILY